MSAIKPVSFKNQQPTYNPSEYYLVKKPTQEDIKQMKKQRTKRIVGSSAIWAGVWTAVSAIGRKPSVKTLLAHFGITFGVFTVASALVSAAFSRRG